MKNIRITFEIPVKVLEQLADRKGFVENIDSKKEKRELSTYLVGLMIDDFEKKGIIDIETEKIARLVSKELLNELKNLDINVNEKSIESKGIEKINLDGEKLNKLKQLS